MRKPGTGSALVEATGATEYVEALGPLPDAETERLVFDRLGLAWCPPELRESPFRGEPPALVELSDVRGDLHMHTTWSDGRAAVREMAEAAHGRGYAYIAICDHTPSVGAVRGLSADDLRRQADEIAQASEHVAPMHILRGVECDIRRDGSLDLPDDVLDELDWVQLSLHAGQRAKAAEITARVAEAMRHPAVCCLSHPKGRIINFRPPNALDLERVIEVALETGVALEINGLPDRLDLTGEHARLAVEAGVPLVVSTDAHSIAGLDNMELAVATAVAHGRREPTSSTHRPRHPSAGPTSPPTPSASRRLRRVDTLARTSATNPGWHSNVRSTRPRDPRPRHRRMRRRLPGGSSGRTGCCAHAPRGRTGHVLRERLVLLLVLHVRPLARHGSLHLGLRFGDTPSENFHADKEARGTVARLVKAPGDRGRGVDQREVCQPLGADSRGRPRIRGRSAQSTTRRRSPGGGATRTSQRLRPRVR